MYLEFTNPIHVIVPDENTNLVEGYAIYVKDGGNWENDCWCVVLKDGGAMRHYLSNQIRVVHNETYGIKKHPLKGC